MILVMGFGMRGAAWRQQIDGLRARHRVVFFDNRGLRKSDRLSPKEERFSMATLGGDVVRLMDELELERAHLVGVSLGGMIAQEAALADQARFLSLTLIATHAGGPTSWIPTLRGLKQVLRAQTRDEGKRLAALEGLLYPEKFSRETDRALLGERMRVSFGGKPPRRLQRLQLRAVAKHDTARRLHALSLPTMIIAPDLDILVRPALCRRLAELIPGAVLGRLPDAGHGLIFQSADQINAMLLEHFARAEAA